MDVYVEVGPKKAFASAVDWPGLARSGRDEAAALARLIEYGPRYRASMGLRAPNFVAPESVGRLKVVQRLTGDSSTDYGVLHGIPAADERPTSDSDLDRLVHLLGRAWQAFAQAADKADGAELEPAGPRGGGRGLAKIRLHVAEAEAAYVVAVGGRARQEWPWDRTQAAFVEALHAKARGELPEVGPRGGRRWPLRYAVRRSAWHALDHAWEIDDRVPG